MPRPSAQPAEVRLAVELQERRRLADLSTKDLAPAPGAAPSPDDLAALAAPAADARWSLYAGPTGGEDQPRSAADIRDHVRVSRNELRSCHALPGAASDAITLHFTVTAEGEVTDAAVSGDPDPDVGDCLSRVMASWHFQPATAAVQVNYPLRFARTARTAPPRPSLPHKSPFFPPSSSSSAGRAAPRVAHRPVPSARSTCCGGALPQQPRWTVSAPTRKFALLRYARWRSSIAACARGAGRRNVSLGSTRWPRRPSVPIPEEAPMAALYRRLASCSALATLVLWACADDERLSSTATTQAITTTVAINGGATGRTFDGVGAISGGGGNSRLLFDYPEPQRSQILDYLFKPGVGAALQILKVEVGGDTNSTSGAEPSHQHTATDLSCTRGYEWWLMEQAKARNPAIKLYALAWGAPGWIGNGTFFSTDMINYYVSFLDCAKNSHSLTIDYLGGWNERGFDKGWYENLKSTLNSRGYTNVKVVADDTSFSPADQVVSDSAFAAAVDVLGSHYVCGYRSSQSNCPSSANAVASGKQIWASENGSDDFNAGGINLARGINRGYLDGKMTAYINWPVIAAITPNIPFPTMGVATATQPWSGAYAVGKNAWVIAHTTQFTAPGWRYLDSASGFLGGNRANGSYVTLRSPTTGTYSTVIETMDATAAQSFTATVTGGLSTGAVHVWSTTVSSTNPASFFVHSSDVTPSNGTFSVTLQPGTIYTLTTGTGQGKGTATGPATAAFALPYSDSYDSYAVGAEARFLADMQGAFEVVACGGGHTGRCVRQMSPRAPITWDTLSDPYALLGDVGWSNYKVSSDVLLEQAGYVELIGRAGTQHAFGPAGLNAYYLRASNTGAWSVFKNNVNNTNTVLASGTVAALGTNTWHTLALTFSGTTITAQIDTATVATLTDSTWFVGQIGVGTSQGETAQFDNLSIAAVAGPPPPPSGQLVAVQSGRCLDVPNQSTANNTQVEIWDCNGGANQQWTQLSNGTLQVYGNKCLDVTNQATAAGSPVSIFDCNGGANQQWRVNTDGTIVGVQSGLCLDVTGQKTANGTLIEIWTCNGGANQRWTR